MKKLKALVQIVFAPFIWIWKQILRLLKFLISKLFLRLVGGALIGSSIYFSESLDKEEHGNLIIALAIFGAVLFLFFDPIADEIDRLKERYQRKILIKSQLKPLSVFLKAHLNIIIDRKGLVGVVESSGIDYNKRDLVYIMIINDLPDLSQNQKDAILLTSLCHEIDDEADILKAEQYKLTIAAILERYNFLDPDDEAKLILKYYNNYQNNKSLATNI